MKRFGSQGQQKSFLVALRLAQLAFIEEATGVKPILLLDDIFDKIDAHRAGALMEALGHADYGQVFISDTDNARIPSLLAKAEVDHASWWVSEEGVRPLGETVQSEPEA